MRVLFPSSIKGNDAVAFHCFGESLDEFLELDASVERESRKHNAFVFPIALGDGAM